MTQNSWIEDLLAVLEEPLLKVGHADVTLGRIVSVVGLLMLAYLFTKMLERGLRRLTRPGRRVTLGESSVYALSRILRYLVWMTVAFTALETLGINLSQLAIVGGAIGVGIGFGLQNIFSNFISGLVLLMEQTLKVGDFVDLQSGLVGRVSEIGMRYTRITTNDSVEVIVPNSVFINGRFSNWTLNDRFRRLHVPFGVAYGSEKDLVREAGLAAAAAVKHTVIDALHPVDVWLVGFGESSLNFELVVWAGPELVMLPGQAQALYLWALETELCKRKLELPFPQRDIHIRSGILKIESQAGKDTSG